jgi:hypothetical protein
MSAHLHHLLGQVAARKLLTRVLLPDGLGQPLDNLAVRAPELPRLQQLL